MGFKKFITKTALRMKGVSKDEADKISEALENNPALAENLKALEGNKEVMKLFEKVQAEIEEKKKAGMNDTYAAMNVMTKYKSEIAKYQKELAPLMELFMKR